MQRWDTFPPLKGIAMTSSVPREPEQRRILLLRPPMGTIPVPPQAERPEAPSRDREDAARHYLKFMLPSIPVATFILTFVLCYVVRGLPSGALAVAREGEPVIVDPTLPFLGALALGLSAGILCMWIYFGYLRVSGADDHRRHL